MRKMLTGAVALFLLNSVDAAVIITSTNAWSTNAVNPTSNNGKQSNTNTLGSFGSNGALGYYSANAATHHMDMQTAAGNVQQNYTAGYTYNYKVTGYAAAAAHTNALMTGTLLANGSAVSGTAISGPNNTGGYSASGTGTAANAISGSMAVTTKSAVLGQTIGLSISSSAIQTRFFNNGSTTVKAILTDHTGINNGNIYSTSFSTNAAGVLIATDYVLDMTVSETAAIVGDIGYFRMNNNTTVRNTLTLGSADDTFRTNTTYRISFDANKQISGDAAQNGLTVSLGTFSTNITIGAATTNYSFDVNATSASIAGKLLNIGMIADAVTAAGTNQYRIYDLTIQALPESATFILTVTGGSGSGSYSNGAVVNITADAPAIGKTFDVWTGDTQYVDSVTSSTATVTMPAQAVALTATYKDIVYVLTGSAGANGTVTPSSTNVVYGSNADFVVTASNYYRIASLTTNGTAVTGMTFDNGSTVTNFTWSNVQADGTLVATFTAQIATDPAGTPYSWLAGYGLTNYDADAVADQDADGLKTWQEYIAGTDPTNKASCLKVAQTNRNTVTWSPVAGRVYSVYWSTNLVKGFTNLASGIQYPQGSYTNTTPDAKVNHYQIRVQLP